MDIRTHAQQLALDHGLDRIIQGDGQPASLPDQRSITPVDTEAVGQLDRLFHSTSLEDMLEAEVRPSVLNRELLSPGAFRDALDRAHDQLRQQAEQDPDGARLLNRCARLLKDELELRDLVAMYRGALYQG